MGLDADKRRIDAYGRRAASATYAGTWIRDGVIHVAFTGNGDSHLHKLQEFVREPARLRLATARYSLAALRRTADSIERAADHFDRHGVGLVSVGVDPAENLVQVMLDGSPDEVEPILRPYAEMLQVWRGTATYLSDDV